jgi:taurine dioxygenase
MNQSYEAMSVRPVTPRIGAEVFDLDITRPLNPRQAEEMHRALAEYQVLFFRDQKMTLDSQKAFGRLFGLLDIHPNIPGPEGHPEILPVHADANSKRVAGEQFVV